MDILRLLGVNRGVVALTKTDLADREWLDLVRGETDDFLKGSPLYGAPVVEVSSATGEGVPALLEILGGLCDQTPERSAAGLCRLAVDRVFTMAGFGTVITGTLWNGMIRQGDLLELLPSEKQVRVRSLQTHGETRGEAFAGERVAVNLAGAEKALAERGSWLAAPGSLRMNYRVDIRLELLPGAPNMGQHARVHVHHGTAAVLARVNLLDRDALLPGESCFAQLALETPLAVLQGDRVLLRFYSPVFTLGGGTVLDAGAVRHKRFRADVLSRLSDLDSADPRRILLASMAGEGLPWQLPRIASCLRIGEKEAGELTASMAGGGDLLPLPDGFFFPAEAAAILREKLSAWLAEYLSRRPLRSGAPKQEAAQALFPRMGQREQRVFFQYWEAGCGFMQDEKLIWPEGWAPVADEKHAAMIEALRSLLGQSPFAPPSWSEAAGAAGVPPAEQSELFQWLLRKGEIAGEAEGTVFAGSALEEAERRIRADYPEGGFRLAEVRDLLGTTRKYAQQLCEYFDQIKVTYRDGEKRYWRKG
jgi:selenocysteine-specific elongation factor